MAKLDKLIQLKISSQTLERFKRLFPEGRSAAIRAAIEALCDWREEEAQKRKEKDETRSNCADKIRSKGPSHLA